MKLKIYHLKTCDTCRKAIKALEAAGHELTLIDVRADGVPADTLSIFVQDLGFETVLNTRSTTWRGLRDQDKADINAEKAVALMIANPTLIKRPVIDAGGNLSVGWTPAVQNIYL